MPYHVAKTLNLRIHQNGNRRIRLAEGAAQPIGYSFVDLTINNVTKNIKVTVLRGFQFTLLLSLNTCAAFRLVIDTTTLTAHTKSEPYCYYTSQPRVAKPIVTKVPPQQRQVRNTNTFKQSTTQERSSHTLNSTDLSQNRTKVDKPLEQRFNLHSNSNAAKSARQMLETQPKGLTRISAYPSAAPSTFADIKDDETKRSPMGTCHPKVNHTPHPAPALRHFKFNGSSQMANTVKSTAQTRPTERSPTQPDQLQHNYDMSHPNPIHFDKSHLPPGIELSTRESDITSQSYPYLYSPLALILIYILIILNPLVILTLYS